MDKESERKMVKNKKQIAAVPLQWIGPIRIHSDELSEMEKNLTAHLGGKVKVTQSMREARMVIVLKGNIEKTGKVLRAIKQALESVATAEVSVDLEIEGNAQATSSL